MTSAREKFQLLLRQLFQIEAAAELDFGIYRIMGQKREVVERFINQELLSEIEKELRTGALREEANITSQLAEIAEQIGEIIDDDAIDAEGQLDPAHHKTKLGRQYLTLQRKATGAQSVEAREASIYNHLYHFFSRYYDKGDFMSLRRYSKREKYAIPYNGEEVYLHWANADQYYIKTGETFSDYRWKDPSGSVRIRFTVTKANVPKDNIKAPDKRYFLPQLDEVTVETVGKSKDKHRHTLITVPFHYRGLTAEESETWETVAADRKLKNGNGNGGKLQAAILAQAHDELPTRAAIQENDDAVAALIGEHHKDADSNPISRLAHHLRRFTVKNTSDYFIHKDLGGFLTRELDFFLKNEVLQLDALEAGGEARAEGWFQMMQAIRKIGGKIIAFLAQIENFQKRLFEKKKFVTECHYCLTLDRVPESLYAEIAKNKEQIAEWKNLFAIDDVEGWTEPPTVEFLKANWNLVIDTVFFEESGAIRDALSCAAIDDSQSPNGLLVSGNNFDALRLFRESEAKAIRASYIDPPYNTGQDDFVYKDNYQHSSWLSLIRQVLPEVDSLLASDGALSISLDNGESAKLIHLVHQFATQLQNLGQFVWKTRNTDNRITTRFSVDHDYVHVFCRPNGAIEGRIIDRSNFKNPDSDPRGRYTTDPLTGKANATDRPNLHYLIVNLETGDEYPPDPDFGWITDEQGFKALVQEKLVYWPANPTKGKPRKKRFLSEASERSPVGSLSMSIRQGEGNSDLSVLFGYKPMNFPKPVSVVRRVLDVTTNRESAVLDFFAGSATTGQAVVELNKEDNGHRRYILVELGDHFDRVMRPRMKKVVYSSDWEFGKPLSRDTGISHCFKYLRLESYEDALGNIAFDENEAAQRQFNFDEYCIHYMLAYETGQSETLLNIEKLTEPFDYKLEIHNGEESRFKNVDLPETFNFLIGLRVRTRNVFFRAAGKQKVKYLILRGRTNPHATGGEREVVVIWRTTKDWNKADFEADKKFVDENEFAKDADEVFVNNDSFIKVAKSLDPVFKRRMFNEPD